MASPFIGELRPFAGTFAPQGWALCDGQTLAISENDALFALIGTTYGGDGVTTFALPDLQGRAAIHQGNGAGLSARTIGEKAGADSVTLLQTQLPSHVHSLNATNTNATSQQVAGNMLPAKPTAAAGKLYTTQGPSPVIDQMSANAAGAAGGNQPHDNMMPSLAINYIIALQGIFPSRN